MRKKSVPIGTVSEGTLRDEDLWAAGIGLLRLADPAEARRLEAGMELAEENDDQDAIDDLIHEQLWNRLNERCAPFTRYGGHEGDPACIGVWVDVDGLDEAVREGVVLRESSDGNHTFFECGPHRWGMGTMAGRPERRPEPMPRWRYRLVVSDHGNMTLLYRNGREVWGVV